MANDSGLLLDELAMMNDHEVRDSLHIEAGGELWVTFSVYL
jgi:hypothetical protein